MVPNLEAGNILAKQLTFLGDAESCGIVLGARVPIALTSRALVSEGFTPEARTRMSNSPGAATGTGRSPTISTSSAFPFRSYQAAFMTDCSTALSSFGFDSLRNRPCPLSESIYAVSDRFISTHNLDIYYHECAYWGKPG